MSGFDKREQGFENKFVHDEEMAFKIKARRVKLLGLWAAALLGKTGDDAEAYAKSLVMADFEEAGDEDVIRKLKKDFSDNLVQVSEKEIRREMEAQLAIAREQLGGNS